MDTIRVTNLTKTFGSVTAVNGISFTVPAGTTYGLLGGNGAGKTTTLTMLLGLLEPTHGRIEILGLPSPQKRTAIAAQINFSSPYVDLPGRLTPRENLRAYGHLYGVPHVNDRIDALAQQLLLTTFLDRAYGTLSAGQKTRVSIAKALINSPRLLLLDEPTASLDPDMADWVRGVFATYQRDTGATILLASHNMPEVERLCAHVLMMRGGQIVDQGSPTALISKYSRTTMEEVFLHIARTGVREDA